MNYRKPKCIQKSCVINSILNETTCDPAPWINSEYIETGFCIWNICCQMLNFPPLSLQGGLRSIALFYPSGSSILATLRGVTSGGGAVGRTHKNGKEGEKMGKEKRGSRKKGKRRKRKGGEEKKEGKRKEKEKKEKGKKKKGKEMRGKGRIV